ncbi:helix-turn-helix domain-containing protein [Inconstantimicrobium porci]|uniref:helix-turn-helix domain-containing protein n=1 Tax=Inconstantimicrobium porci TaxID=2652291 RepID=UPI002E2717C2
MVNLADKLQLLRKKNLLSQEELAEKLGISRQAVSKWESGQSLPDLNKLKAISKLYNVTIDSLVNDDNEIGERNENKAADEKSNTSYEQDLNGKIVLNINKISVDYEYKSKKTLFGLPLVHINLGGKNRTLLISMRR